MDKLNRIHLWLPNHTDSTLHLPTSTAPTFPPRPYTSSSGSTTPIPNPKHQSWPHHRDLDITHGLKTYLAAHEPAYKPVSRRRLLLEASRPRLLRECLAEATGTFFFLFCGLASSAGYALHKNHELGVAAFGSHLQTGLAFGVGVALAVITCAPTSGGHFNPAVSIAMAFWQDFPWWKVPLYILSQITGAFTAALLIMGLCWPQISAIKATLLAEGKPLVGYSTPASIFCAFPQESQTNMGVLFGVEFLADACIALVIWAALDPANPFLTPPCIPFVIGLAYSVGIWGFGFLSLSTNLARDLGPRIVVAMFFGREAFTYMGYSPIALFVNVPATLLATAYYEFLMRDSLAIIGMGRTTCVEGDGALHECLRRVGVVDEEKGFAH